MIEYNDILALKDENPGYKFIYVLLNEHEYIFRSLTRKEYKSIMEIATNDMNLEETVCTVSCMYPQGINFSNYFLAGLPGKISTIILEESGFLSLNAIGRYYDESKRNVNSYDTQLMLLVKAAFPEYTLEEIENWTFQRLIDMAVKSEIVMAFKGQEITITNNIKELENFVIKENEKDIYEQAEELRINGVDPMMFNKAIFLQAKEYVEMPIILGSNWQNEGVLNGIREQMEKRKTRRIHRQKKTL